MTRTEEIRVLKKLRNSILRKYYEAQIDLESQNKFTSVFKANLK